MSKSKLLLPALLAILPAWSQPDPVASCRAAHGADAEARIACLESALRLLQDGKIDDANGNGAEQRGVPVPSGEAFVPSGLGAEQVEAAERAAGTDDDKDDDTARVRIVATRYDADGLGTFVMADGQVWRETSVSPARRRLDATGEYEARIERGFLGGYRMYVDGIRSMKTVRRIE